MKLWATILFLTGQWAYADELPSFDATHCELYVNSFGVADLSYAGVEEKALDVDLIVDEEQLSTGINVRVVRAGAGLDLRVITAELGDDGAPFLRIDERRRVVIAEQQFGSTYRIYFPYERRRPVRDSFEEVIDFAFFVDVLRIDGETVRLWQNDRGGRYTMQSVFGSLPGSERSIGIGVVRSPEPSSVIFDYKRQCGV